MGKRNATHGMKGTATYDTWRRIRQRCNNPKNKDHKNYGGRGIYVCDQWGDFSNFYADMGEKPQGLSIERIDNDGPYSKGNCRWATTAEQNRNRRITVKVEWQGKARVLVDLCDELRLDYRVVQPRVQAGWPISDCLAPRKRTHRTHKNPRRASSLLHQDAQGVHA